MVTGDSYLFTSARLGFRNWLLSDINADTRVMSFFPSVQSKEQTIEFIERMQKHFDENRFCYFAVDILDSGEFIGFIGLCKQTYKAEFTPCVDIGWRLKASAWKKGYATEGAKRCLEYAFKQMNLKTVLAVAPQVNIQSIQVMINIGMRKLKEFKHPLLGNHPELEDCVLYEIRNPG